MKSVLIYYGWLNAFNSAENSWDNENVAQAIANNYDIMVFGDGVQDPSHSDYANTQIIINRIKEINSSAEIFGYVTLNQDDVSFRNKVEQWETLGVHGIFVDEAGYDYGTPTTNGRDAFNSKLAFIFSQTGANKVIVNAWNPHHVISKEEDPSYPNATYNVYDNESLLRDSDYYLFESLIINTDVYTPDGVGLYSDCRTRKINFNAANSAAGKNIKGIACGIINDDNLCGQCLFNILYSVADMLDMYGVGSSDIYYGATNSSTKKWVTPPAKS